MIDSEEYCHMRETINGTTACDDPKCGLQQECAIIRAILKRLTRLEARERARQACRCMLCEYEGTIECDTER